MFNMQAMYDESDGTNTVGNADLVVNNNEDFDNVNDGATASDLIMKRR